MTEYFTYAKPFDNEHYFMRTYEINIDFDYVANRVRILITNIDTKKYAIVLLPNTDTDECSLHETAKAIITSRGFTI